MNRLQDAVLPGEVEGSFEANILYGGQNGYAEDYQQIDKTGEVAQSWLGAAPYVSGNVICIMMSFPKYLLALDKPQDRINAFKAMFEKGSDKIAGLVSGTEYTYAEQVLGDGNKFQVVSNAKRKHSIPIHTWTERRGLPFSRQFQEWGDLALMHPVTKFAEIGSYEAYETSSFLPDMYSVTNLYFELDPTHRFVEKAWVVANMQPMMTPEITGSRDKNADGEMMTFDITFTALVSDGIVAKIIATDTFSKMEVFKKGILDELRRDRGRLINGRDAKLGDDVAPVGYN